MKEHQPKVSGFTFVRNGLRFDYPFLESIKSLLPLVDQLVINVGKGDDDTEARIRDFASTDKRIEVFTSEWDESVRKEGRILAQQTDLALARCRGDWGLYLQADEVIHEKDYPLIREAIREAHSRSEVEGIRFRYHHFYGDFFVVNKNPSAYRHEVRGVRLGRNVFSWKDAQGFRRRDEHGNSVKLKVVATEASIYHYGWVRPPEVMRVKTQAMDKLYHGENSGTGENYLYKRIYGLERFTESHPKVMEERIEAKRWKVDLMDSPLVWTFSDWRKVVALWLERTFAWLPGEYRNYRLLK
jgi:hypothetical protein